MVSQQLAKLASAIDRLTGVDGIHDTAVESLKLYRSSNPTTLNAVVYEPSFCLVAQGAKEVILAGENYRYDPAQSLLVSVDLPASAGLSIDSIFCRLRLHSAREHDC